jgi:hypothetical protein
LRRICDWRSKNKKFCYRRRSSRSLDLNGLCVTYPEESETLFSRDGSPTGGCREIARGGWQNGRCQR